MQAPQEQPSEASALRAGLQSQRRLGSAGVAKGRRALVVDRALREVDQGRGLNGPPRPVRDVSVGRGAGPTGALRQDSGADPAVGSTAALEGDVALMLRIARGDEGAFRQLQERYSPIVRTFLAKRAFAGVSADDLLQEVLIRAWRNAARFRGESRVKTYLLGIAVRVHQESIVRARREMSLAYLPQPSLGRCRLCECGCGLTGPEAAVCRVETLHRLAELVAALPPRAREAVGLTMFLGTSASRSAGLAGCTRRTLGGRFRRALHDLADSVSQY